MIANLQRKFNLACENGDLQTVKAFINHPDVDPSDGDNFPIRWAAYHGHKEVVKFLIQDSRVDPSDWENDAIRWSARLGHKDIVELLLTDERVMDNIDYAFKWCKGWGGGYELLKVCVDERERTLKHQERESDVWELIAQMEKDADIWF